MVRIAALVVTVSLISLPAAAQDSVAPKMSATASQAAGSASAAAIVAVAATVAIPFVAAADIARQAAGGTKLPLAAHRPVPAGPTPDEALRR